jgi:fatty acid desaturase
VPDSDSHRTMADVFTFIVVLLLLAAIFGVLGAVLKVALALVLAIVLTVAVFAWGGWLWLRYRMREFEREAERERELQAKRRRAIDVRHVPNEAERTEPLELPGDAP